MQRVLVALAGVLLAAGCGGAAEESSAPAATSIEFTAETVGGGDIDMADYAGEPLALWFWSPW